MKLTDARQIAIIFVPQEIWIRRSLPCDHQLSQLVAAVSTASEVADRQPKHVCGIEHNSDIKQALHACKTNNLATHGGESLGVMRSLAGT